ncbi:hypothetical protein HN682_03145, partial [Candidatus Peregrinibacteria bacterium]|nr:hypothetical protein [Candidatus Peregrinibacteria bacterium]
MANNETVTIFFKADGDKDLINALKGLSQAEKGLVREGFKVATAQEKVTNKLRALSVAAQKQGTTLAKLSGNHKLLGAAARGSGVAMRKLEARVKGYSKSSILGVRNTRILGGSLAVLRSKLLIAAFAILPVIRGFSKLFKLAGESAKIKTMERSFLNLGKELGFSSKSLERLQDATDNTVDRFGLLEQANNALLLGVVKNDKEMAQLFDTAQRLAKAVGKDAKFGIESLVTGLGRQSRLMLDNLGIIVKSEEAYKSYAIEIGKTVNTLTAQEKKTAFLKAGLESARVKVEALGAETLDASDTFKQLSVDSKGLGESIGLFFTPALVWVSEQLSSLAREWTDVFLIISENVPTDFAGVAKGSDELSRMSAEIVALEATMKKLHPNTRLYHSLQKRINQIMRDQTVLIKANNNEMGKAKKVIPNEDLEKASKLYGKTAFAQLESLQATKEWVLANEKAFESTMQYNAVLSQLSAKIEDILTPAFKTVIKEVDLLSSKMDTVDVGFVIPDAGQFDEVLTGVEAFSLGLGQANDLVSALGNNVQANMRNDIAALKKTDAYRNASSERRKTMEDDVVSSHAKAQQRIARLQKASSIAQAILNTHDAYPKALTAGPIAGPILATIIAGLGAAQVAAMISTPIPQFAEGGSVGGRRPSQGGTLIEAEQGEFILSRDAVAS